MADQLIKIIFMGTAGIAEDLLVSLSQNERFDVLAVVTQPDKPSGRKMQPSSSPIKIKAKELGLSILQPESVNAPELVSDLKKMNPDFLVVMAYGQILSQDVLNIPSVEPINFHASILPKYRGASPVQSAILAGDNITGISVMRMVKAMDSGSVYISYEIPITTDDTTKTLSNKLAEKAASEGPDALIKIFDEKLVAKPQNESEISYCQKIQKSDGEIVWNEDVETIMRKIRAFNGWPSSFTHFNGSRLKIVEAQKSGEILNLKPGTVVKRDDAVIISAKNGSIEPTIIQIEGKNPVNTIDFIKGNPEFINSKLD